MKKQLLDFLEPKIGARRNEISSILNSVSTETLEFAHYAASIGAPTGDVFIALGVKL